MTEPSKDCPLCGARWTKASGLVDGVTVVMTEAIRQARIARNVALWLALCNAVSIVLVLWTR